MTKYRVEIRPDDGDPDATSGWARGLTVAALILAAMALAGLLVDLAIGIR